MLEMPFSERNASHLRLTEDAVYPKRAKKMAVKYVKTVFSGDTISYMIAEKCEHQDINLTAQQLRDATAVEMAKLPFAQTITDEEHHPYEHLAENLVKVRYLQGLAMRREESRFALEDMVSEVELLNSPSEQAPPCTLVPNAAQPSSAEYNSDESRADTGVNRSVRMARRPTG